MPFTPTVPNYSRSAAITGNMVSKLGDVAGDTWQKGYSDWQTKREQQDYVTGLYGDAEKMYSDPTKLKKLGWTPEQAQEFLARIKPTKDDFANKEGYEKKLGFAVTNLENFAITGAADKGVQAPDPFQAPDIFNKITQELVTNRNKTLIGGAAQSALGAQYSEPKTSTVTMGPGESGTITERTMTADSARTPDEYRNRMTTLAPPDTTQKDWEANPTYQANLKALTTQEAEANAKKEGSYWGKSFDETSRNLANAGISKPNELSQAVLSQQAKQIPTAAQTLGQKRLDLEQAKLDFRKSVQSSGDFDTERKPYLEDRRALREEIFSLENQLKKAKNPGIDDVTGQKREPDAGLVADIEETISRRKEQFNKVENMIKWTYVMENKGNKTDFADGALSPTNTTPKGKGGGSEGFSVLGTQSSAASSAGPAPGVPAESKAKIEQLLQSAFAGNYQKVLDQYGGDIYKLFNDARSQGVIQGQ